MRCVAVRAFILASLLAAARSASCDERFLPGHSHYGEAFDRGPRQSAYLMGGTGNVHFPVSSKIPLVQKFVEQGVGQLHGFWYVEAERSFREAARLDPSCGIAYWGMSLAAQLNKTRVAQFAAEAGRHKAGLTERERMYINALGNDSGYRAIMARYPQDLEAKAFEVWRLWNKSEAGAGQISDLEEALGLAREILSVDPMHPIHHAVIHITDATNTDRRGLDSAGKCGDAAPSIGHMWHMPTHIYSALKRYPEAAWQLEAAMRTEHARMIHDHALPYQVHLYAHNNEWLVRMLLNLGRVREARQVATQMIDLPRHPLFNAIEPPENDGGKRKGDGGGSDDSKQDRPQEMRGTNAYYGRERLIQTLRRFEYWDELVDDCRSGYIEATRLPAEQGKVHMNVGVASYSRDNVAAGDAELVAIRQLRDEQVGLRQTAFEQANQRPEIERSAAISAVNKRFGRPLTGLESQIVQLEAYRRIASGFFLSRGRLLIYLGLLVAAEAAVVWGLRRRRLQATVSVVAAMMIGGWLFYCHLSLVNLPADATFVDFAFVTRKQLEAGDFEQAEWSAREFAKERPQQVRPQANLVEVFYKIGKRDEARAEFEALRELAGMADLDSPPLARLAPFAQELGLPTDWRKPEKMGQMLEGRRPLASLGPLLWRPWSAPDWNLTDAQGRVHTLTEFHGKPVLMLFFLGRGCLHCQQQLDAFAKQSAKFSEAGLTVLAVSTDDQAGVKKSLADYAGKMGTGGSTPSSFPFLMLADPKSDVFRAFRAYDDFEQISLHGTVLIDPQGFVRWQDISFEPFLDAGFVLSESKRLLARPVAPTEPGARIIVSGH